MGNSSEIFHYICLLRIILNKKGMRVFIAESNFIIQEGLRAIIDKLEIAKVVGVADSSGELIPMIVNADPDVLFVNYSSALILDDDIELIINTLPNVKVIGITDRPHRNSVIKYLQKGIDGHLLYSCDAEEISESILSVTNNERFFCGRVLEVIDKPNTTKTFTHGGVRLSNRETEIITLVAEGFLNKEIAEQLFLSVHTVLTHRKNLMAKLGLKISRILLFIKNLLFIIKNLLSVRSPLKLCLF